MDEAGFDPKAGFDPRIGTLDPLLLAMALQSTEFSSGGRLYQDTMARAMAAHLVKTLQPKPAQVVQIDDRRLRRASDMIEAHLAEDLSLADLATTAGMSATHFAKAFKKAVGQSPLQYVIGQRLDRARILLQTTGLPVTEIAHRVGYNDTARLVSISSVGLGHPPPRSGQADRRHRMTGIA